MRNKAKNMAGVI